jgi:hypothetical protein
MSTLPHDLFRSLVLAQAKEPGMAQFACSGPLAEGDLSDEFWFHPMHIASWQPIVSEGASRYLQLCKRATKPLQRVLIEPGPDLACVNELAPAIETRQQGSETNAASSRIRLAANDKLLLFLTLEFEPVARSSGHVNAVSVFAIFLPIP